MKVEPFCVKFYSEDPFPSLKGNGFDGLQIGKTREEAEEFVKWINEKLSLTSKIPIHLRPHEELKKIAEKCSASTPAHWDSGQKRALLGFVNLHIGYDESVSDRPNIVDHLTSNKHGAG